MFRVGAIVAAMPSASRSSRSLPSTRSTMRRPPARSARGSELELSRPLDVLSIDAYGRSVVKLTQAAVIVFTGRACGGRHGQEAKELGRRSFGVGDPPPAPRSAVRARLSRGASGPSGLTQRQFTVLAAAGAADGVSQSDLVRATGIDRSTLADLVARMIAKGLLERERSATDARANTVRLSARARPADRGRRAGREVRRAAPRAAAAKEARHLPEDARLAGRRADAPRRQPRRRRRLGPSPPRRLDREKEGQEG